MSILNFRRVTMQGKKMLIYSKLVAALQMDIMIPITIVIILEIIKCEIVPMEDIIIL